MKHIYKFIFLSIIATIVLSCSNNPELIQIAPQGVSVINTPSNNDVFVLNPAETLTNTAITITWDPANYETSTIINYTVEFALSGTNFAEPTVAGTTTNTYLVMNITELNAAVSSSGLTPFTEGSLDIRIKSDVGTQGALPQYSDPVTILVTPYTTELPKIAVPGNHQGWDPPTAELLAAQEFGATNYEGYVWLDGGHKFVAPDSSGNFAWGNIDWGDDGTFTGILLEDGEVNSEVATAGYYFIQADTSALTYSETMYDWGLIGSATPNNWDSDQNMTYDSATKTWTITLDLTAEEIKFRANDAWDWNYGDNDADGSLENGGANIVIPTAGNYTVVLDLSTPRQYTYTLTLN